MVKLITAFTLFTCIENILSRQPCVIDTNCDFPGEICSIHDLTCYKVFNSSDYANATIYTVDAAGAITGDTGIDTDNLLDHNTSTTVTLPTQYVWYRLQFILNGNYWVHRMELEQEAQSSIRNWYIDGASYTISSDSTPSYGVRYTLTDVPLPMKMKNMSVEVAHITNNAEVINMIIAGAYDTPEPSASPTQTPTDDSSSPTAAPSAAPTTPPSAAPTGYPTPDICEEYLVTQSCCGHFGYEIADDKVNIRDPTLLTCERNVTTECCGTTLPFNILGNPASTFQCDDHFHQISSNPPPLAERSAALCDPSYFNTSVNATDDIVGVAVKGTNTVYNIPQQCDCEWALYECEGDDVAMCGAAATWNDLWDTCNETWSVEDDFLNETCWKDIIEETPSMEHILWEPCSEEAFIGSVTEIQVVPNELIYEDTCTCSYAIRNCFVLEDRSKRTQCDFAVDCAADGECSHELAAPCCGYDDYEDGVYGGVTPELDADDYPTGVWSCNNEAELCPDLFNGTRVFTAESSVNWWYDGDANKIEETCGCLYVTDECNLPTTSPTTQPTVQPTEVPTEAESEDDHASFIVISYVTYCTVLFIAPLLFM